MEIRIMPKNLSLTTADDTYLRNRLYFGLAANHRDVVSVGVSLSTSRGSESGGLHRCRVDIALVDGSSALGASMETNLYVAMDLAVDRACAGITRNVDWNWREFSRTGPISSSANLPSLAA